MSTCDLGAIRLWAQIVSESGTIRAQFAEWRARPWSAGKDPFRSVERSRQLAARTGAELLELPDSGHLWMLEQPAEVAAELTSFWGRIT